ncbi:hypothetical protein PSACC_00080 [Paramicrosporidium saccamoebae]|uniref:Uncharacterized protein n=1 Tax=Paramicrosporidium saccamoebae TaxID=1246581 RepID=A0A2H9TQT5_9FUNG|nr:hypothetical protein PSACC_00080 [Paramicrosporidium saccamoebae]
MLYRLQRNEFVFSPMSEMDVVMGENSDIEGNDEFIQPVALLMDELKSEETAVRVESMKRLGTIALALGPERTRNELVPFLQSSLDEEDEVLTALAEEITSLLEYVGGAPHGYILLPLLEGLVSAEETYVRNTALDAFELIIKDMPEAHLKEHLTPAIQRLASGDWFSKKSSASVLIVALSSRVNEASEMEMSVKQAIMTEALRMFAALAVDETPLVRKAVANNLVKLIPLVDVSIRDQQLNTLCSQLAADPQDSVRLLAVEPVTVLMEKCSMVEFNALVPLFLALASDNSWRIRFMVAKLYGRLAAALVNGNNASVNVLDIYCALMRDAEAEVRSAACSQITSVSSVIPASITEDKIISSARTLLSDPSAHVRAALALQLNQVSKVLGSDSSVKLVLPMVLQLLRDESSDVRLNVISRLEVIVEVIGIDQLAASLLPAIVALAEDRQWRVRQTIIEYIPELSSHLGRAFFEEKLAKLAISWLNDAVFAVRETAVDSVKRIIQQFGSEWTVNSGLLQQLLEYAQHRNYLRRMTLLSALSQTCCVVETPVITAQFVPILEKLASDPIANVRFNVAKALQAIVPILIAASECNEVLRAPIVPMLQELQRDADSDVRDHATLALNIIPVF